ncbi:hypothetical protein SPRA44_240110 [Serratia proteamaculans]|nr:hypothetical protein SPRA44_240110 [Serratia proteamaculans]
MAHYTLPNGELLPWNCLDVENKPMTAQKYSGQPRATGVKNNKGPIKGLKKKYLTADHAN